MVNISLDDNDEQALVELLERDKRLVKVKKNDENLPGDREFIS